jgi:glutamate racemase
LSTRSLTIGIRDSGVGGLTVARCIHQALPHARLLYFADTAHVPYGERTPEEVRHFALSISRFLIKHGAQLVVFACNTSSAYALDEARATLPVPVVGMIEPGARAAIETSPSGRIGVIATQATVQSGVYSQWIKQLRPDAVPHEIGCPEFVPLVESEKTNTQAARTASRKYLQPLLQAGVDTLILGCTHYPLLLPVLREAAPQMRFVDPAEAVACEVKALVAGAPFNPAHEYSQASSGEAHDIFFASGESEGLRHWIANLLPDATVPDIRRGPVFDLPHSRHN